MINDSNIWKLQVYSERAWRLSSDLAIEAGRLGRHGKGIAVVSNEARTIANVLFQAVDKMKTGGGFNIDLSDLLWRMNQLVLNASIETIRMSDFTENIQSSRSVLVAIEDMRLLGNDLMELLDYRRAEYLPTPEVIQPSRITDASLYLFQTTIGDVQFVENIRYVVELIVYGEDDGIQDHAIMVRGKKIPVIDCYDKLGLTHPVREDFPYRCAAIMNMDWYEPNRYYAVLVDDLAVNSIFKTKMGIRTEPNQALFPKELIRESWDAAEGRQFVFLDWVGIAGIAPK